MWRQILPTHTFLSSLSFKLPWRFPHGRAAKRGKSLFTSMLYLVKSSNKRVLIL